MKNPLLIKKYANRRLYDTEKSTYISLNHVAEFIKQGRQVKVLDAKSQEDVTAFILTQIILEEAKNNNTLLPVPLLHLIIQYGGSILSEFFEKYLQLTLQNYLRYKAVFDEQFKNWLGPGKDFSSTTDKPLKHLNPFQSFFDAFANPSKESEKKDR
ncbi:MAG: transcriptional regulator [Deltaproteobacteria bacterium]|nr:transcriptional regulator [Deltaproteobacteria bacterium]